MVGPLHFEPTDRVLEIPAGSGPVVVVAPSTALTGTEGLAEVALGCLRPGDTLPTGSRLVVSRLGGADLTVPPWAVVGLGSQAELLTHADVVICGGGHGMVAKTLLAGVPLVVVPGGGDQWEMANRVARQGSGRLIRPLTADALVQSFTQRYPCDYSLSNLYKFSPTNSDRPAFQHCYRYPNTLFWRDTHEYNVN